MKKDKEYAIDKSEVALERGDIFINRWNEPLVYAQTLREIFTVKEEDNRYTADDIIFLFKRVNVRRPGRRNNVAEYTLDVSDRKDWQSLLRDPERLIPLLHSLWLMVKLH